MKRFARAIVPFLATLSLAEAAGEAAFPLEALLVPEGESVTEGQAAALLRSPTLLEHQKTYLVDLAAYRLADKPAARHRQLFREGIIAERRLQENEAQLSQVQTAVEQGRETLLLAGMVPGDAEVVAEGARRRLRPVVMTARIAGFGLVPLLLASGPGSEIQ